MDKKKSSYVPLPGGRKLKAGKFLNDDGSVGNYIIQKSFMKNEKWNNDQKVSVFVNEVPDLRIVVKSIMDDYLSFDSGKVDLDQVVEVKED